MGRILESFRQVVRDRADDLAWMAPASGRSASFRELAERVAASRLHFADAEGRRVALAVDDGAVFIELFLALRLTGLEVVLLDATLPRAQLTRLAESLGAQSLLVGNQTLGTSSFEQLSLADAVDLPAPRGTDIIKVTSGCTGEPVGVCFTEEALWTGVRQIAAGMEIDARDRVLLAISLSHSYGFDNGVLSLAVLGTPLILQSDVYPHALVEVMRQTEATFFPAVPPLVRALTRHESWPSDLALRRVICAAGPLAAGDARRFREVTGRPVHQFYGCTESGGICFEREPDASLAEGTVGTPLPGVDVRLDPQGRVEVRSRANWLGRLGEESTADARVVRPGDIGEWTSSGRLRLTGRTADILKVGGRKVHASRIESALRAIDGVDEAAVVGIEDAARGDRVVAFLVSNAEAIDLAGLPADLAPREVHRLTSMPYTGRGKLDREELRRLAGLQGSQRFIVD